MICRWPRHRSGDAWSTHTLLPDFVLQPPCEDVLAIRRRGSSSLLGAQKNVLRRLRNDASQLPRPHTAAGTGLAERPSADLPRSGGAPGLLPAMFRGEARAAEPLSRLIDSPKQLLHSRASQYPLQLRPRQRAPSVCGAELALQHLYRAMDFLEANKEAIESAWPERLDTRPVRRSRASRCRVSGNRARVSICCQSRAKTPTASRPALD